MAEKAQEPACRVMGLGHVRDLVFVYLADLIDSESYSTPWARLDGLLESDALFKTRKKQLAQYLTLSKSYAGSVIKVLWARADSKKFSEMSTACAPERNTLYRNSVVHLKLSGQAGQLGDLIDVFKLKETFPRLRYVKAWFEHCSIAIDLAQTDGKPGLDIRLGRGPLPLDHPGLWLWPAETARFRLLSLKDKDQAPSLHQEFSYSAKYSSQLWEEEEEWKAAEAEEKESYGTSYSIFLNDKTLDERDVFATVLKDTKQLHMCVRSMPLWQFRTIAEVALELESIDVVIARRDSSTAVETRVEEYDTLFQTLAGRQHLHRLAIFALDYGNLGLPPIHSFASLEVFEWHLDLFEIYRRYRSEISLIGNLPLPPSGTLKRVKFWIPGEYAMSPTWFTRFLLTKLPIGADVEFQVAAAWITTDDNDHNCGQQDHQNGCGAIAFAQWVTEDYDEIVRELRKLRSQKASKRLENVPPS